MEVWLLLHVHAFASCSSGSWDGGLLVEYAHLLAEDAPWTGRATVNWSSVVLTVELCSGESYYTTPYACISMCDVIWLCYLIISMTCWRLRCIGWTKEVSFIIFGVIQSRVSFYYPHPPSSPSLFPFFPCTCHVNIHFVGSYMHMRWLCPLLFPPFWTCDS